MDMYLVLKGVGFFALVAAISFIGLLIRAIYYSAWAAGLGYIAYKLFPVLSRFIKNLR